MFAGVLLLLMSSAASAQHVIVHADVAQTSVSRSLLRGIFGMRVRLWPDGQPVHVFVLDDTAQEHEDFCRRLLRVYPYQLRQAWDRLVYSGTGQPPTRVRDAAAMRVRVASTPGAIGYLPGPADAAMESVRVLYVE